VSTAIRGEVRNPERWPPRTAGLAPPSSQLARYMTDPREGDVCLFVPGATRRRALFWGNALGILPLLLAERFEHVVVVDSRPERLAFARARIEAGRIENATALPEVPDGDRFDLVALGEEDPDAITSLPFLGADVPRRLASLLEAGGALVYGARFPRLLARARQGVRALADAAAHRRVLRAAGFARVSLHWRQPPRRPYEYYVPLDDRAACAYHVRWMPAGHGRDRLRRAVARAAHTGGLLPYLVRSVLIVGVRP
jgi:hypothetical protein